VVSPLYPGVQQIMCQVDRQANVVESGCATVLATLRVVLV
jgi:hypothetical protein